MQASSSKQPNEQLAHNSDQFIAQREEAWQRLEKLVDVVERESINSLSVKDRLALPHLYRATLSSLSVARSLFIDRQLAGYLESLVRRAYLVVYTPQTRFVDSFATFLVIDLPAAVRQLVWPIIISALTLFVGGFAGWAIVDYDLLNYFRIMPDGLASGRDPYTSEEALRETLYSKPQKLFLLENFAIQLFINNASVAILAFGLGLFLGIPTLLLLFQNGLILGAFISLFEQKNLGIDVFAWLSVHGTTEIGAIILAGGAGLAIAQGVLFPRPRESRMDSIKSSGIAAGLVLFGAIMMLVLAAFLEAFARQLLEGPWSKLTIGWVLAALWLLYFRQSGRTNFS